MKKIKTSKRGLTFAFSPTEYFSPGDKYNYTVYDDKIVISPGTEMTISRKRSGNGYKSLVDIRSASVLKKLLKADYIEIEILEDHIIAHICRLERSHKNDIEDVVQCRETETICIPSDEDCVQLTFFEDDINCYKGFSKPINAIFKVLSLFSGAGMLDYPFKEDSRYQIILANDIGKGQTDSYKANIGSVIVNKDIRELRDIPSSDLVIGGPSCKPFSNVNRHTRLQDHPDYFLISEYIRCVKQSDPKVFVIENVPEFVTTAEGKILEDIITQLSNYEFTVKKIVDSDVGGYTNRKRVIIIGSKIGKISLNEVKNGQSKTVKEALDKVDASWFNFRDFSHSREDTKERMAYVRNGHNWKDVPIHLRVKSKFADYLKRLDPNGIAPAIVNVRKSCIMPPVEYINGEQRCLSVAECSALMGFPKEFRYLGTLDERQQQVANGVPYRIARLIKDAVTKRLLAVNS